MTYQESIQWMGMLPTPTRVQMDYEPKEGWTWEGNYWRDEKGKKKQTDLTTSIKMNLLPTPTAQIVKHGHSEKYWDNRIGKRQMDIAMWNAQTNGTTSQLSPQFVMEMMGFPTDWTELPFLSGETNQLKPEETQ
jgi:hypothetical protein